MELKYLGSRVTHMETNYIPNNDFMLACYTSLEEKLDFEGRVLGTCWFDVKKKLQEKYILANYLHS